MVSLSAIEIPLLDILRQAEPASLFLSVSHGYGPDGLDMKLEDRRQQQGAPMFDGSSDGSPVLLTAEDEAKEGRFLPYGLWFILACYSAGTPRTSLYERWLGPLTAAGETSKANVSAALRDNEPFIAAL